MSTPVFVVAIVFGSIVLILGIIAGTILMGIRMRHGTGSRSDRTSEAEEARMIQEIFHGLSRLEQRVEALETILMDQKGKEGKR
jgi:phage shock protein B